MDSFLEVTPNDRLTFTGPFTDVVTAHMTLKNTSSNSVCFKVKTTAPKQFWASPNTGLIIPGDSKQIKVMMQPFKRFPSDSGRHKFQIQSCVAPAEDIQDFKSIWKNVDRSKILYNILRTTFIENMNGSSEEEHKKIVDGIVTNDVDILAGILDSLDVENIVLRQELEDARRELVKARKEIEDSRAAHSQTRFECEICLQQFTDIAGNRAPKVLRCGHTICSSCVNSLQQNNSVTCPFCRVVTSNLAEIYNNFIILGDNQ
ncbi:hypothetical protein CRE_05892 [Caenorhabditis remanei]|uniref:Major sperm protein n=1 Tax=Caenorhabditis remanei TaxID=31234 RepID=E3MNM4_CAERE|nr:hypothetical protein CRE_05892 [Caenorhabditis remanei]